VLHAGIVSALGRLAADRLAVQIERLAHHACRGEIWEKALHYCRQAGARAMARSANREAAGYFEQALVALQHLPETRDTLTQAIDLRLELRNALVTSADLERVHTYLRQAESMAEALGDQWRLGWVLARLSQYFWLEGTYDSALSLAQRAATLAAPCGDVHLEVITLHYMECVLRSRGDYRRAIDYLRKAVALLAAGLRQVRWGADLLSVHSRGHLAGCLAEVGAFAEGMRYGEEALQIAETGEHTLSRVIVYDQVGRLYLLQGEVRKAVALLERGLDFCKVTNFSSWFASLASTLGAAYTLSGRLAEALPLLQQAVQQATSLRLLVHQTLSHTHLSEAYLLASHLEEAYQHAQQALSLSRTRQERGYEAYILRLLGDIHRRHDPPQVETAEGFYRQALALADELGMRPLQAHCHSGLGRLYRHTGQSEHARAALSTAIDMYRDMHMTFWLPQAQAALAEVESR
jgi:tetratricopeptide (TPR) repeat protein